MLWAIIFTILIFIVAVLLIGIVLIQNAKGGGLASNVGISTQMMGVKKTADAVEKMTWYLIGILVFLCVASGYAFSSKPKSMNPLDDPTITTLDAPFAGDDIPTEGNQ